MNAEYFHNDGKDAETEVLYHEIGHADGATYKLVVVSLSRDSAVQPLIHKEAYQGYVNYVKVGRHCFGTYMSKPVGGIKTDLDRGN